LQNGHAILIGRNLVMPQHNPATVPRLRPVKTMARGHARLFTNSSTVISAQWRVLLDEKSSGCVAMASNASLQTEHRLTPFGQVSPSASQHSMRPLWEPWVFGLVPEPVLARSTLPLRTRRSSHRRTSQPTHHHCHAQRSLYGFARAWKTLYPDANLTAVSFCHFHRLPHHTFYECN
jgi:hypothetical protein